MVFEEGIMTEPPADPGVLHRAEEWVRDHVAPDVSALKADAERFREVLPHLATLADLAVTLAKADPGIPPQILAEAEEAAEVVARIAAELAASGM